MESARPIASNTQATSLHVVPTVRVTRIPDRWHWLNRKLVFETECDRIRVHVSQPVGGKLRLIIEPQRHVTLYAGRQEWHNVAQASVSLPLQERTPEVAWDCFEVYDCTRRGIYVCYWCDSAHDQLGDAVACSLSCWNSRYAANSQSAPN
jgi:hypothetical protein